MDYKKRAVEYKAEGYTFKELKESFRNTAKTYYEWKNKLESRYYKRKQKKTRSKR